jgi:hypothetical protein
MVDLTDASWLTQAPMDRVRRHRWRHAGWQLARMEKRHQPQRHEFSRYGSEVSAGFTQRPPAPPKFSAPRMAQRGGWLLSLLEQRDRSPRRRHVRERVASELTTFASHYALHGIAGRRAEPTISASTARATSYAK